MWTNRKPQGNREHCNIVGKRKKEKRKKKKEKEKKKSYILYKWKWAVWTVKSVPAQSMEYVHIDWTRPGWANYKDKKLWEYSSGERDVYVRCFVFISGFFSMIHYLLMTYFFFLLSFHPPSFITSPAHLFSYSVLSSSYFYHVDRFILFYFLKFYHFLYLFLYR